MAYLLSLSLSLFWSHLSFQIFFSKRKKKGIKAFWLPKHSWQQRCGFFFSLIKSTSTREIVKHTTLPEDGQRSRNWAIPPGLRSLTQHVCPGWWVISSVFTGQNMNTTYINYLQCWWDEAGTNKTFWLRGIAGDRWTQKRMRTWRAWATRCFYWWAWGDFLSTPPPPLVRSYLIFFKLANLNLSKEHVVSLSLLSIIF